MSAAELHPVLCLLLAALCASGAYSFTVGARIFWRDDRDGTTAGTVLVLRGFALAFVGLAVLSGWLAILYAVAGLYPPLAFLYGWLVL